MTHGSPPLSPFDVAAYVREMAIHLAGMAETADLVRLASVLQAAAWLAAEEAGRLAQARPAAEPVPPARRSRRKAGTDEAP